jgi:hypothetical protein
MSRRIKRDSNGQFAAGASGNPDGARRRKLKELLTVDRIDQIQLEIASEVVMTRNGKSVSRYEHLSLMLASGKAANRLAARDFMELTMSAAERREREKRRKEKEEAEELRRVQSRRQR